MISSIERQLLEFYYTGKKVSRKRLDAGKSSSILRDVSKSIFLTEDIVELDQAEIENKLLAESNKILSPLGVNLNFITLTFDLDDQTRQAIDVSTAMKIYESKNLGEIGKQVIIQKAGAARLVVESNPQEKIKLIEEE